MERTAADAVAVLTDAELMGAGAAEFGVLFDRHARVLYQYCVRRIGPAAVEDAVADTFLIAYERRDRFDQSRASALPWLFGIATNVIRRHRTAETRYQRLVARLPAPVPEPPTAERAVERADAEAGFRTIAAELARMSARHRDVLFLYAAGLSYAEIAEALGIPAGTVMSRLHRARQRLRAAHGGES